MPSNDPNIDVINNIVNVISSMKSDIDDLKRRQSDKVEIKSTAGDYADASSWDGRRVLNTNDNTYKIFEGGSWRQIVAW